LIEISLLSFALILVAWIVAPDGTRAKRAEAKAKVAGSVAPARA
jgi:hypothetical protein